MLFTAVFAAIMAIAIIAALRSRLVFELQGTSLLLFGTMKPGLIFYTILILPGTMVHELSHWITAEILQVRTGQISIFPDWEEGAVKNEQRLGSVETVPSDPIRGFIIGIAPFITGLIVLIVLSVILNRFWGVAPWWQLILIIYGIIVTGNSMMISKSDRRNWPVMIALIIAVVMILEHLGVQLSETASLNLISTLTRMDLALGLTAGINLATIGLCFSLRRIVERITHKKISRR